MLIIIAVLSRKFESDDKIAMNRENETLLWTSPSAEMFDFQDSITQEEKDATVEEVAKMTLAITY